MDKAACEKFASTFGGLWEPVAWQGMNSYTLRNEKRETILQFRGPKESLANRTSDLATKVHGDLAPYTKYLGTLPGLSEQPVVVWQMSCLPGDPYLFHVTSLNREQVSTAVVDLAKFFAAAWKQPQCHTTVHADQYTTTLKELLAALPVMYHNTVNLILDRLDEILTLRPVLTHSDLSSGNILIDPKTGCLTGVVDWAEATIEPFGWGLWGLQDIMGFHGPKGYSYVHDEKANRDLFRQTFLHEASIDSSYDMQYLELARLLGVLLRFGYTWDSKLQKRVPITTDGDLEFLTICIQGNIFDDTVIFNPSGRER